MHVMLQPIRMHLPNIFWLTACLTDMLIDVPGLFMHMPLASMDLKLHGPTVNITDITRYLLICCLPLKNGHRRLTKGPILVLLYHSAIHQVQACIHVRVLPQLCPPHATHVPPMSCLCPAAPACVRAHVHARCATVPAHVVPLSLPVSMSVSSSSFIHGAPHATCVPALSCPCPSLPDSRPCPMSWPMYAPMSTPV